MLPIPLDQLVPVLHTDASLGNNKDLYTQAGYIIAFSDAKLLSNKVAPYSPVCWKSFKLKRPVSSTLAAESQVLKEGTGHTQG